MGVFFEALFFFDFFAGLAADLDAAGLSEAAGLDSVLASAFVSAGLAAGAVGGLPIDAVEAGAEGAGLAAADADSGVEPVRASPSIGADREVRPATPLTGTFTFAADLGTIDGLAGDLEAEGGGEGSRLGTVLPLVGGFAALGGEAGRGLPGLLHEVGIEDPAIDAHVVTLKPGHPYLQLPLQFSVALESRLLETASEDELASLRREAESELAEPGRWGTTFTLIQSWGTLDG